MRKVVFLLVLFIISSNAFSQSEELESIKKLSRERVSQYVDKLIDNKRLTGCVNLALALQDVFDSNDFTETDIVKLTCENGSYWRAAMEKTPKDSSVLYANAYLCAAFGQIAYSDIYFLLGSINVDETTKKELDSFKEIRDKLYVKLSNEISDGIKLHDEGQYEKAIEIYDIAINKYPEMALPYYEKGLSCMVLGKGDPNSEWGKKAFELYKIVREKDPFFWRAYQGNDPNIINQQKILLEKVLPFYSGQKRDTDSYIGFAEGCEQLELYPFAAHAQLKLSLIDPPKFDEHIDNFFELIEKSGFGQADTLREMFNVSKMAEKEKQQQKAEN
jgi:tetratricopeptide (TPR) repeat protein